MTRRLPLFTIAAAGVVRWPWPAPPARRTSPWLSRRRGSTSCGSRPVTRRSGITVDSFMAVKGQGRSTGSTSPMMTAAPARSTSRFKLDGQSLLAYPDGTPFGAGDSVRITIRVVNPDSIYFQFEPAGLTFDPAHPAQLKIEYAETGGDFNEDGTGDARRHRHRAYPGHLAAARASDSFTRLQSIRVEEQEEIDASLLGFTRYAIAY